MVVRIPLVPLFNDRTIAPMDDEQKELDRDRIREENRDEDEDSSEETSGAANIGSSALATGTSTGTLLTALLGMLILTALVLFGAVWRKHDLGKRLKKRKMRRK
jgi:hypothetical protein